MVILENQCAEDGKCEFTITIEWNQQKHSCT